MTLDARDQRAICIAAMARLDRKDGLWLVPSQTSAEKKYTVDLAAGKCTCPDCEAGYVCKHLRAVKIVLKRELGMDGSVTETKSITFEEKRTYGQDWPSYHLAQTTEKKRFLVLLHDLCRNLPDPEHNKSGPKPHRVCDSIFSMVYKVYVGFSARRFACDLDDAHEQGYLSRHVPGMKVTAFMENADFKPILIDLIQRSAAPLAVVEKTFAVDSTGFSSSRFETWIDHKYGIERRKCMWVKVHCAVGCKTNVVTAIRVLDKDAADCPQFGPLMKTTGERFNVQETVADKAYLSAENVEQIFSQGGTPYIMPKLNTTGGIGGLFEKMVNYYKFRQADFLAHYHQRSNVESSFSAIKRLFGDSVRSKTDAAMVNECLCKVLAFNLTCLIHEQTKMGLEPIFWPEEKEDKATVLQLPAARQVRRLAAIIG